MGPGKGKQGLMQQMSKQMGRGGNMNPHNMQMNIQQMSRMLPPQASLMRFDALAAGTGNMLMLTLERFAAGCPTPSLTTVLTRV
jgi:hypothetical protein